MMYTPSVLSLDEFPMGCVVTNARRRVLYSNRYIASQYGHAPEALAGRDLFHLFSKASRIVFESFVVPALARDGQCEEIRLTLLSAKQRPVPVVVSAVYDDVCERCFWSIANAQRSEQLYVELKKTQQLLEHKVALLRSLSHSDPLTGLPNRAALSRDLDRRIVDHIPGGRGFALAFIDLDGFKEVNDRHGHAIGDRVLQQVAERLTATLRQNDLIARFGGDEFVVVVEGCASQAIERTLLARLGSRLAAPFVIDDIQLTLSASIGVTLYPQARALEPDQLVRQADNAMYQAKLAGKNQVRFFDSDDEDVQKERHSALVAVNEALVAGAFELYYQPKVNMRTGEVFGAEALIRWNHPERGLLGPHAFLPALGKTLCGVRLGRWVLATALDQLAAWHRQGLTLGVSVNIDGYHLLHPRFLQDLGALLDEFPDLPRGSLELEVLETSAIEDVAQAAMIINACRTLGLRVSLDDFGTGYSSLSQLRDLPVDTLKIDRSFVQNMLTSRGDLAILKGVIGFATAFECEVIAEGVESLQHGRELLALGCEQGQGYYIARPMPADALPGWVQAWHQGEFRAKYHPDDTSKE
ncbi:MULTISPECIES: bifunctional diguanylate cyclase/phosphodiesterase [unclassified Halomonas]|uniref:putative bifunctional diguanylate cyclase/phosphodiesterase n=1 Tax=unclassified Halomonas TaxID=2609666 RepID=UPI0020A16C0D|nr:MULTISPECIES: GGDEF and EAL domain-containing protein [unclassified Halomonas]MCP1315915.1 EAL domain-containing protein [Halomonas sp. 707D7]MCP1327273.1 EAL domain-containing protein [Halomonas sp. 707D4]